jgi:hypothetical protein
VGWGDPNRMDTGLREGRGTVYCEHLLPRKAGRSVPFHGIVNDAQPHGPGARVGCGSTRTRSGAWRGQM